MVIRDVNQKPFQLRINHTSLKDWISLVIKKDAIFSAEAVSRDDNETKQNQTGARKDRHLPAQEFTRGLLKNRTDEKNH